MRDRFIAIAIGGAVALLFMEIALRLLGVSSPPTMKYDSVYGMIRRADRCWNQADEGHARVCINSQGFRDEVHSLEKPRSTLRIAVLGDSYIEAVQVEPESRVTEVLEGLFSNQGGLDGKHVEVLNFGVSGFGTSQERLLVRNIVNNYSPDIVLLEFMSGNDVLDNARALSGDPWKPYFTLDGARLTRAQTKAWSRDWFERQRDLIGAQFLGMSFTLQMAARGVRVLQESRYQASLRRTAARRGERFAQEMSLSSDAYATDRSATLEAAWQVTERLIHEIHEECRHGGATFGVFVVGGSIEVHPDVRVRREYCLAHAVPDLEGPLIRIQKLGRDGGFPVLPLSRIMADCSVETCEYFHGFPNTEQGRGHWNEGGHAFAARTLFTWIQTEPVFVKGVR